MVVIEDILKTMWDEYGTFKIEAKGPYALDNISVNNIKPLSKGGYNDISFCGKNGDAAVKDILESKCGFIVCDYVLNNEPPLTEWKPGAVRQRKIMIFVDRPRLWFARMLNHFFVPEPPRVFQGLDCRIDPFVALGLPGFGYVRDENGGLVHFPHYGDVRIGSFVDIGASSAVDRATMPGEFTTIGDGCKIDNLVHIAHNVTIGSNCTIVSHCNIGGSCTIGDGSYLGMSVVVNDHVKIGKRCVVGSGSLVIKDLPDNTVAWGHPIDHVYDVDMKPHWAALVGPLEHVQSPDMV